MTFEKVPDSCIADLPQGQISPIECKLLYWLASEIWTGLGEIVEIGSLYGKSTVCLARGMRDNKKEKRGKLHAFDKWREDDENEYMLGDLPKGFRGSFRGVFDRNTESVREWIVPHEGDLFDVEWCGKPIEILFIDCSVSKAFHEMVFQKFYPFLKRGSILVHQDYFLYRSYYLPLMMGKLCQYLEEKGNADTSMVFQALAPIPERLFASPLAASDEEMIRAAEELVKVYGIGSGAGGVVATMLVYLYRTKGDSDKAASWIQKITESNVLVKDGRSTAVGQNLKLARKAA